MIPIAARLTPIALVTLVATGCDDSAGTTATAEEAARIRTAVILQPRTAIRNAINSGNTTIDTSIDCVDGTTSIKGDISQSTINVAVTPNRCVQVLPDGAGQFIIDGDPDVRFRGPPNFPGITGRVQWQNTASGQNGTCDVTTDATCGHRN